jgi:hypothetical protein
MSNQTCINYFTYFTQENPPIRKKNRYQKANITNTTAPCDTWICGDTAYEYACMGINYTLYKQGDSIPLGKSVGDVKSADYMTIDEWQNVWNSVDCVGLYQEIVNGLGTIDNSSFSQEGFRIAQDDFMFMFSRYFNQDPNTINKLTYIPLEETVPYLKGHEHTWIGSAYNLTVPGQQGFNTFLTTLTQACQQLPGVCEPLQTYVCESCTRQEISSDQSISTFCGCVAPPPTKNDFYNTSLKNYDPACDPICNRISTIKNVDPKTGLLQQCNANVCVIDNVVINAIDTKGASPTFTQVCPACADGSGNCICIIDATFESTITGINGADGTSINNPIKFTQYCPNSQCFINDPITGNFQEVKCANTLTKSLLAKSGIAGPPVKFPYWILIAFAVILVVVLLVIISYKYQSNNIRVYEYIPGRKYKSI